jgi:hypothetical protein
MLVIFFDLQKKLKIPNQVLYSNISTQRNHKNECKHLKEKVNDKGKAITKK